MRHFLILLPLLFLAGPVLGPAFILPKVVDTRLSIQQRIGLVSNLFYSRTCQSNIMAGIFEVENLTHHRYIGGPKKGTVVISPKGAIGAGQIMPCHGISMGLNLYDLGDNIEAAHRVFHGDMLYYLSKGYGPSTSTLMTIQSYFAGRKGRLKYRNDARKYMKKVLRASRK